MDIRDRKALHAAAVPLAGHPGGKQTALIYIGISCALSLVVMVLDLILSRQIESTGGLGSMSLRSALATAQTILPIAQSLIVLCLGLGYQISMLDLYRHRSTEPRTLKEGFRRFAPLLRLNLFQAFLYIGLAIAAFYISCYVFIFLPFSSQFVELVEPLLADMSMLDSFITMDNATALAIGEAMTPLLWIFGILYLLLVIPVYYRYRMSSYCLCEDPVPGALSALRQSRSMMRRNRFALFQLDLSFWWYYLLQILITCVSMAGSLLLLAGMDVPWAVEYLVFPIFSLALQFLLYYVTLNRVTLTYAAAYDALRPQPEPTPKGVPLGNIFDLYRESNEYRENQEK